MVDNSRWRIFKRVCRKTTTIGPVRIPIGPRAWTPPTTLNKANIGCNFEAFCNTNGLTILSDNETGPTPQIMRNTPYPVLSANIISQMAAGNQTTAAPTKGTIAKSVAAKVSSNTDSIPAIQKPRPARIPCASADRIVAKTTARLMLTNSSISIFS